MKRRSVIVSMAAAPWAAASGAIHAAVLACPVVAGSDEINIVGNAFPAVAHIARIAAGCARPGLKVAFKLTPQARTETEQAFASGGTSAFDAAVEIGRAHV